MFTKSSIIITIVLVFTSGVYAQGNRWSFALTSSYFGDQSRIVHQVTAIDKPISLGMQLQYFMQPDFALQFSIENMSGKTLNPPGDELNVQSSLALMAYPFDFGFLRPYLLQGIIWGRDLNNNQITSRNNIYFDFGLGAEFLLTRNMFSSVAVKLYTDGGFYHGWGTSLSVGYRL